MRGLPGVRLILTSRSPSSTHGAPWMRSESEPMTPYWRGKPVRELEKFLKTLLWPDGTPASGIVKVYATTKGELGTRVHEVSYSEESPSGIHGASWMRSEPDAGNVILQCECFLIEYVASNGKLKTEAERDNDPDFYAEARESLRYLIKEKE